jgi:hypothetical protein
MAKEEIENSLSEVAKVILLEHLKVGPEKPVSYLPIRTVENVLGITLSAYRLLIENQGNRCAVFQPEDCCINSGAIYAYSEPDLVNILRNNHEVLIKHGWPIVPSDFIRRIASEWLGEESPIEPIVRKTFGEG